MQIQLFCLNIHKIYFLSISNSDFKCQSFSLKVKPFGPECSNHTDLSPPVNFYPLLVIIMAVILFLLLITSLSFTISYRYGSEKIYVDSHWQRVVTLLIILFGHWSLLIAIDVHGHLSPKYSLYLFSLVLILHVIKLLFPHYPCYNIVTTCVSSGQLRQHSFTFK